MYQIDKMDTAPLVYFFYYVLCSVGRYGQVPPSMRTAPPQP